ncbi:MAG: ATP-dependent Clp protease proteolytic subunit [Clostridia bacterium]|nr:ATP-dependent Clp protease proteolytic subunit [Clostridia bacterium]
MYLPTVIDKIDNCEHSFDIYSRLLEDRIIFITGEIDDLVANTTIAELLYLESKSNCKDIYLYINSPGGVAQSGLAILDTMRYLSSPVSTICIGLSASAAALILAGGSKGKRFVLPHSKVMIHQPLGGIKGQVSEIEIYYKEGLKDRNTYASLLAEFCGKDTTQILADIERDNYLSATEAVKYGIVDKVLPITKIKGGAKHAKSKL